MTFLGESLKLWCSWLCLPFILRDTECHLPVSRHSGNGGKIFLQAIIALLLVGSCLGQPTITLSVSSGPPTTKLLVSGSGFDPYAAVDIYFDTKDEALAVTDGNGVFGKIGINVPGPAKPGGHWVSGVERYTGLAGQNRFLVNTNWAEFH